MTESPTYEDLKKKLEELEQEICSIRENALKSEERYRAIFDRSSDAVYIHDLEGHFLDISEAAAVRLGYTRDELKGMKFSDLLSEDQLPLARKVIHELIETGYQKKPAEFEIRRRDGRFSWIETSTVLIYSDGKPYAVQGIARRITERKNNEKLLKSREARYRTIFENTGNASILFGENTAIILANSNFARLSGYTREELESGMSWTAFVAPEDRDRMIKYHRLRIAEPENALESYEFTFVTRSGEKRNIFLTVGLIPETRERIASCMDITDRKKAEIELKQSEERFRALQEASSGGILIHDMGVVLDCNQALLDQTGYSMEELKRMNGVELIAPACRKEVARKIREGFEQSYDAEGLRKDGSIFPMEVRGKNVPYHGRIARVTEMRDITFRKKGEQALRASEERYRNILDGIEEAYYEVDLTGNFTFFNSSAMVRLGYTDEELKGMNFREYVDRENKEKVIREYSRVYMTRKPVKGFDWEIVSKNGKRIPVESSVSLIYNNMGEVTGFKGVVRDITERKKAEEALKQSEERFRDIAELLPETVYEADETGRLTYVNESALKKFQYGREVLEEGVSVLDMVAPEERERVVRSLPRLLSGERLGLQEYTALKNDGTTFPVLISSIAIMKNGRPAGVRGFVIDVSDKKNLEAQFIRAQKMEAIGSLAGGIAHDFNNLLMGILGNISLMLMSIERPHPFYERLKSMEEYVRQGSDITKQFLGFAQGGKYEVKATHFGDFIRKSSDMFRRTRKEVRMHLKIDEGIWLVEVDRGQMDQVFLNIFVNAWQAMPGGGDLYLAAENVELKEDEVEPYGINPGKFVRVSVTDTGIGMDDATKARIFEPFFTTKEKGRGTGLGLASVYGIIRNHKGFITVESEKGAGSTFIIHLPATEKALKEEPMPVEEVKKGGETILVIDDERVILDVGTEMLEHLGYKVITASGGREGLITYQANKKSIGLVILDMIMPDLGGSETFEKLKEIDPGVKVLLSSGYSIDGQAEKIMEKGCRGFIQKPFGVSELAGKIRDILDIA